MRRSPVLGLLAAAALAAAGCSTSPCQTLGERLCACTGQSSDTCKTQVEQQVNKLNPSKDQESECDRLLDSCKAPEGAVFCDWLRTSAGKVACGVAPDPSSTGTTQ